MMLPVCLSLSAATLPDNPTETPPVVIGNFEDAMDSWRMEAGCSGSYATFGATLDSKSLETTWPGGWKIFMKKAASEVKDDLTSAKSITMDVTWRNDGGQIPGGWLQLYLIFNVENINPSHWYQIGGTGLGGTPYSPRTNTVTFAIDQTVRDKMAAGFGWGDICILGNSSSATHKIWIDNIRINYDQWVATNPVPADGSDSMLLDFAQLSWAAPNGEDPNVTYEGYKVYLDIVTPPAAEVTALDGDADVTNTAFDLSNYTLVPETTYYWRVDTIAQKDYLPEPNVLESSVWSFVTITNDPIPVVDNVITTLDVLAVQPAVIAGTVFDADVNLNAPDAIQWQLLADDDSFPGTVVERECMQMQARNQSYPTDPNLLKDWIGTDTRESGNPLQLTISGLPEGTYTWTSYHHDTDNQTGMFDMTVNDADGPETIYDIDISAGSTEPVRTVTTTVVSDGSDVTVVFYQHDYTATDPTEWKFFAMNGFDLVKGTESLKVDFGTEESPVQPGYAVYKAANETVEDFDAQGFPAFGATVTLNPDWLGGTPTPVVYALANTTTDNYSPMATFVTDTAGTYKVRLTATDDDGQAVSDLMEIRVYADACAAAKANPNGYTAPQYDFNNDCIENLGDFAFFGAKWLENAALSALESYEGDVDYTPVAPQP